jgi:simple sugar transport system substrate-binding protein
VELAASELTSGKRTVFTGPLKDNKGGEVLAAGQSLAVADPSLGKMNYLLDGVVGSIP